MILTKRYPATLNYANTFNELFNQFSNPGSISHLPAVNIFETAEGYELDLNAPGRNKEDFKVHVENGLLTISYEQKPEAEGKEYKSIRKEFDFGSFKRTFCLDKKINADGIDARYENGILKVYLPKKEEVKSTPKQIQIQ